MAAELRLVEIVPQLDPGAAPERVAIQVRAGNQHAVVAQAEAALISMKAGIYQRGGQLVRVAQLVHQQPVGGISRAAGSPVVLAVTRDYLLLALSRAVDFAKYDDRRREFRPIDPPTPVASLLLASAGEWAFPELLGVVSAPTLRPDGTVLQQAGFDDVSGLFLVDDGTPFPEIPQAPTREEAMEALDLLDKVLEEFEFSGGARGAHAAAALAAIITACVRYALPTAPGFGLNAHKAGSGKTTLGHTIARIPTGRDAAVMPLADDENEVRKTILSLLIAADLVVLVDNIAAPVNSAALCAALTSSVYKDRILGESRTVALPTAATFLFNGNHLEFVGDLTSRILLSTLDPECERPEARRFKRDQLAFVAEHRGELVKAALVISLAYRAAGEPQIDAAPSRFKEWDRFVRRPLLWLDAADPLATQEELRVIDPVRSTLIAVLTAWKETFGDRPASVAQAYEAANGVGFSENPRLQEALVDAAGERDGKISNRRLGRYLKRHVRVIEDGLRFEAAGKDLSTCRLLYRVTSVASVSASPRADFGVEPDEWPDENAGNAEYDALVPP
jgi:hypothetical protein